MRGLGPQRMRKNIKASLVNSTLNMRYKNDKKYQICHHHIRFFQAKNAPKSFSAGAPPPDAGAAGAYDAPPDPLVGWGGGYPLPIPLSLDVFGVSNGARFSGHLNTKF